MGNSSWEKVEEAVKSIRTREQRRPTVALVLGSGLGDYADSLQSKCVISYDEIPGFPVSTVRGHAGCLVIGEVSGLVVAVMKGRVHLYEGYPADLVTFPIRVLKGLGADTLIITNSAGGVCTDYVSGDLVAIADHLNLSGTSPLLGPNDDRFGPRFPDFTEPYQRSLIDLAKEVAAEVGVSLKEGVYAGLLGPTYETPAEVRMLRKMGADLVGMSTVCEVIVARHAGMRVFGCSCVSNLATGISGQPVTHAEVTDTAERVRATFQKLIDGLLRRMAAEG